MNFYNFINFSLFSKELLSLKLTGSHRPLILVWSLTNRCNLSCKYCGLPYQDHSKELRGEKLLEYLLAAKKCGTRIISLTGGEPLVHPDIIEFMRTAHDNRISLSLNSNGILVEEYLEHIKKYCFEVIISWDGIKTEHDLIRGNGSSDRALRALHLLRSKNIRSKANCVLTKHTFSRIKEILQNAKAENIPISFQPVWDSTLTYQKHPYGISEIELNEIIETLIKEKKSGNFLIRNSIESLHYWKQLLLSPQFVQCKAGKVFARIEPSGNLKKCGRVEEEISYESVLSSGINNSFKKLLEFDECTTCHSCASINVNKFI